MTMQLARNLFHLMRGASRRTTLEGLKKRGHRNVAVLDFRDVQALISRSIENTLQRRGLKLDDSKLQDEVRHEFLSLMRERDALQSTVDALLREKNELGINRAQLEQEITRTTAEYEQIQHQPAVEEVPELKQLMDKLEASLRTTLGGAGVDAGTIDRTVGLVSQAFSEHQELVNTRVREAQDGRLDQLQRRIGKLKRKLEETEEMLARARAAGAALSIEGEPIVAGVKGDDPNAKTKRELLGEIFRLNVELRQMLNRN